MAVPRGHERGRHPGGDGLGVVEHFTTALLKSLHIIKKNIIHPAELAEQACHIEIDVLGEPIGKQDQYIAVLRRHHLLPLSEQRARRGAPLGISNETLYNLEDNLLMFFTGYTRSASAILKTQDERSRAKDREMIDNLHFVKEIGREPRRTPSKPGDLHKFAELMNEHWEYKKQRSAEHEQPADRRAL